LETTGKEHTNYLAVGGALIGLTFLEVLAVNLPIAALPFLILFGGLKVFLIAMFFMHLQIDRRLFAGLFALGVFGGAAMVTALIIVLSSHLT
jgi:hypothetical protein